MITRDAASAPAAARLRLVTDLEPASAAVPPDLAAARSSVRAVAARLARRALAPRSDERRELTRSLAMLGPEWRVVRGLPGVDALMVGPSGVHALVVLSRPGGCVAVQGDTVAVDGDRLEVVPHARSAAARLTRALAAELDGLPVHGIVAVVDALPRWALHEQPRDAEVRVFPGRVVPAYLAHRPAVLDADRVVAIARAAAAGPYRRPAPAPQSQTGVAQRGALYAV